MMGQVGVPMNGDVVQAITRQGKVIPANGGRKSIDSLQATRFRILKGVDIAIVL